MSMILTRAGVTNDYDCLTSGDLIQIPATSIPIGSTAFVANTAKLYYLDTDRTWKEVGSAEGD